MSLGKLFGLTGRVAVVTGGASGIGLGIAKVLGDAGATVMLADSDQARAVAVNVADEDSVVAACADMVEKIGVPWLLVNNAALQDREPLLRSPVRLP